MKRLALASLLVAMVAVGQDRPPPTTIDLVYVVPNGFKGPVFVDTGRVCLPKVVARQKNTYVVCFVDQDGEAVQIGSADKVSGWTYKNTVVQRNGISIKTEGEGTSDDDVAFRAVGGFGPWKRAYRPGGFAAYFIGTKKDKEAFHAQLEKLIAL